MPIPGQIGPSTPLNSIRQFTGTGAQVNWEFSFTDGYINRSYVKVTVISAAGVKTYPEFTFAGDFTLNITPAVALGSELFIYRDTPRNAALVDFQDAAIVNEVNLDLNARQAIHIAAETADRALGAFIDLDTRTIKVPAGEVGFALPGALDRRERVLYFDADGKPFGKPLVELPYVKGNPGDLTPGAQALLDASSRLLQTVAPLAMAAGALAIYDLALAFSGGIDGSHYLIQKQFLFQDSAGTIAVTGTEQPVRCIKSPLGVSGWDLISEVGRPAATYFETAWGTAFVRLAAGTCLYTRTVQKIRGKSFLATGANFASTVGGEFNSIFGGFKYTSTYWRLTSQTLNRVGVEISGGTDLPARPYLFDCAGANFGYQPGSPQVIHATHSAGVLETTFDQSTWADSFSPKNTGWLDTDEILGARYGVNIQTNDAAGAPVPNPTTTVDFYGGVIMVGAAPTPEVKTAIVASLQARMHPPITAADKVVLVVADSISDSVGTDVAAGVTEWVRKLGTRLQTKYPDHCVFVRDWNSNGDCYMGYRRFGSIYATKRLFVINASRAGSQPGYFMAERFDRAIGWLPKCDWHIIAHGHNIPVDDATIRASAKVYLYRLGTLMMAQDKLRQKFPMGQPIIITPYPVQAVGDQKILGVKNSIDQGMVPVYGDQVVIDLHTPWEVAGRPANRYVDGVHPTVPVGVDAMDAVIWPVLDALPSARTTQATPAVITQRRLGNTADQLLANGTFDQFTVGDPTGVPAGWEPFGAVVVSRSNELAGRSTTIKMVKAGTGAAAGLRQTINAVALRGLDVCLLVRRFMLKGSGFSTGGMRFRCDGGDALGDGRWVDYEYLAHSKMLEGYFPFPVPNTATTLTIELLAGDIGEAGTVWWDYTSLVPGILPRGYIT